MTCLDGFERDTTVKNFILPSSNPVHYACFFMLMKHVDLFNEVNETDLTDRL
jgi:hypothetical protein